MFCDEPGCDCRRVFFSVLSSVREEIEAVVAWGWEDPAFYAAWMKDDDPEIVASLKGPTLNLGSPATSLAPAVLEVTRAVLLQDRHYVERVKRHYRCFASRSMADVSVRERLRQGRHKGKTDTAFALAADESAEIDQVFMTNGARADTRRVARTGGARQRTG
jgi:hypothetical protein